MIGIEHCRFNLVHPTAIRCYLLQGGLPENGLLMLTKHCENDLGLKSLCSFRFREQALLRIADACGINGPIDGTVHILNCESRPCTSHSRLNMQYCPVNSITIPENEVFAIENMQLPSRMKLVGPTSRLGSMGRC